MLRKLNKIEKEIGKLLPFNDFETSSFMLAISEYVIQNQDKIKPIDLYNLGIISCNIQFEMRILKSRIEYGDNDKSVFNCVETNNKFIKTITSFYPGLIQYIVDRLTNDLPKSEKFYEYMISDNYRSSYFNNSEANKKIILGINKIKINV